jgi:hypothetical protein
MSVATVTVTVTVTVLGVNASLECDMALSCFPIVLLARLAWLFFVHGTPGELRDFKWIQRVVETVARTPEYNTTSPRHKVGFWTVSQVWSSIPS